MSTDSTLYAGAARVDSTPHIGTCLFGYKPNHKSTYLHDPLSVTALALSQNGKTVLMITAEIGNIQTALHNEIVAILAAENNLPAEHIVISCTHTHTAPNLAGTPGWGEVDRTYCDEIFLPAIRKAAKEALAKLAPAEFAVGETESKVGVNRRIQYEDGSIGLEQNPYACYDPYMTVIAFRNAQTKEGILNLIHYGCHGTSAGLDTGIGRDWSGPMIDRLETESHVLTAYWNGAEGDVGPRNSNGSTTANVTYTAELGAIAALDALRAYRARGGYHTAKLGIFTDTVHLPYQNLPSQEEVAQVLAEFGDPSNLFNLQKLKYEHYKEAEAFWAQGGGEKPAPFTFPQTIVSLGEIVFIPFPFEMFSEIVMRLRAYAPYRYTLCLSNTNGSNLYLPSEDQLCRGGYEVACFMYGKLFPLAPNTDQTIINENLRIIRANMQ
ncbi:MAG: neutral/alkaline non-lysosomal ceramidase N-terminal domain-containing protein [Clostridia bacterium]|nr:neutral/alkaline non-lysosomal ceramidase N-terminal domain-containing protein [Clostridia bacterium]